MDVHTCGVDDACDDVDEDEDEDHNDRWMWWLWLVVEGRGDLLIRSIIAQGGD